MPEVHPTVQRLEDQINWYNSKSSQNQRYFQRSKVAEIVIAAFVPFLAGIGAPPTLTALAGVSIVVLEGLQSLFQFQHNWITYRSTCESLKHEKHLWLGKAGPYLDVENPTAILADRIEGFISQEHSKWLSGQEPKAHSR